MWMLHFIPDFIIHALLWVMIIGGTAGLFVSKFLRFLPMLSLYVNPIKIASAIVLLIGVYFMGAVKNEAHWLAKVEEMKQEIAKKEEQSKEVTTQVVTKYVDRVKIVKEISDVQIQTIPTLISKDSDDKCVVPVGFGVLHDAAAKNEVPDTSGTTNDTASGIKLSEVAETVVENYGICTQNSEQLKSLQEWIRAQQKIYN
jgi:hypothetical protein